MTPEQRVGAAFLHGHSSPRTGFKAQSSRPLKGRLRLPAGGEQRTRATRGELPPAVTTVAWEHPGHGARGSHPVREVGPAPHPAHGAEALTLQKKTLRTHTQTLAKP